MTRVDPSAARDERRYTLIVNPQAAGGRARESLARAREALAAADAPVSVITTRDLDHGREAAREAGARGPGSVVVAVGGDGLVGAVAGELSGAPGALGIVPGGRGNDYARALGLDPDPMAAARALLDGTVRDVDIAEVNGRPFVGIASVGLDSEVNEIANDMRLIRGNLVYLVAAVKGVARWKHATFTVTVDGARTELYGYAVGVANSGWYGGGMNVIPQARIDDGKLDVFLNAEEGKLRFLRNLPKRFDGSHVGDPAVSFLRGTEIEVAADRPFTVYADGEPIATLPITVRLRPGALRVVAPAPAQSS